MSVGSSRADGSAGSGSTAQAKASRSSASRDGGEPQTSRAPAALELTDLRRRYGSVAALDGLSFTVPAGQVFGFLGPNGTGMTEAISAIVGVAALDAGTVRWNGDPIGVAVRRRIGYMPEERGLYPTMRVAEHLEYLARLHGLPPAGPGPRPRTGSSDWGWAAWARLRPSRSPWATSRGFSWPPH